MAKIYSSDPIQKAVTGLLLSPATDKMPSEVLDKVQLTYDLTPQYSTFMTTIGSATTGVLTGTPPNTTSQQEIYITAVNLSYAADATCDISTGAIALTITPYERGIADTILRITNLTLTAGRDSITLGLPYPLRIKNQSVFTVGGTFTVGACRRDAVVIGFIKSSV